MLRPLRQLPAARHALAGIEFAIILPLLLTMLAGLVDVSLGFITLRRVTVAAQEVAVIASTMAVQTTNLNVLTGQQAWQATTAPFANFPAWRDPSGSSTFSITLSAIDLVATPAGCTGQCTYAANTRWSVANPLGQAVMRPCGTLGSVPNGSPPSRSSLPAGVFGPTSLLVGDVSTVFVPLFTGVFTGPVPLLRSAYISPRVNNGIRLQGSGPGPTVVCPVKA